MRGALLDIVLLPAYLNLQTHHIVGDRVVAFVLVAGEVAIHLVYADDELLHSQQVDEPRVLACLALDLAGLVVALGDRCGEVPVRGDHDQRDVRLRGAGDHVLDEDEGW